MYSSVLVLLGLLAAHQTPSTGAAASVPGPEVRSTGAGSLKSLDVVGSPGLSYKDILFECSQRGI